MMTPSVAPAVGDQIHNGDGIELHGQHLHSDFAEQFTSEWFSTYKRGQESLPSFVCTYKRYLVYTVVSA